jgi:hypothetical protein
MPSLNLNNVAERQKREITAIKVIMKDEAGKIAGHPVKYFSLHDFDPRPSAAETPFNRIVRFGHQRRHPSVTRGMIDLRRPV